MEYLHRLYNTVKEYIFPVFCISCAQEGTWLCPSCSTSIDVTAQLSCPVCHTETEQGVCCDTCPSSLDQHIALIKYEEDALIGTLIHTLKYHYAEDILSVIQLLVDDNMAQHTQLLPTIDVIIPVPLHKKRFAERGFNQALHIARMVAPYLDASIVETALIRTRHTPHQATLKREARIQNVENAFSINDNAGIAGKTVLLVDDVYTTGSTMQSCAQLLCDAGAVSVHGWSLARG